MILVWPLLVFAGIIGWGSVGTRVARRFAGIELGTLADRLGLGLVVAATLIGLAVAVGLEHAITAVVLGGVVLGIVEVVLGIRSGAIELSKPVVTTLAIGAGALALVGLYAASRTLQFEWNPCDDDNYLFLAQRLVQRGNLADPSNVRRIQSLGAMTGFQAMYLDQLGDRFLPFADIFLGSVLTLTVLWRTRLGRWSLWGIGAAVIVILAHPTIRGMDFNSSPILLPVGLFLWTGRLLISLRDDRATRAVFGRGVVVGLAVAVSFAMRQNIGQPIAVLAFVVVVWPPWGKVMALRLGAVATGGLVGLLGWSIASWRDVATPLYPLLAGNADPDFPALGVELVERTPAELLSRTVERLASPMWILLIGVALIAVVVLRRSRPRDRSYFSAALLVQGAATVISVLWLVAMTLLMWNIPRVADNVLPRYYAWLFVGVGLLPILIVNDAPGQPERVGVRASVAVWVTAVIVLVASSVGVAANVRQAVQDVASGAVVSELGTSRYEQYHADYDEVAAHIPAGSKVFTAVDLPGQLLDDDLTVHSIDLIGFASPPPHLPYFEGDDAKTEWLRANGYDYLIGMVRDTGFCFYRAELWHRAITEEKSAGFALAWEPYISDWSDYIDDLQAQDGSETYGRLVLIPL